MLFTDVLYAAMLPSITQKGIEKDDFCDSIMGDVLDEASYALMDALADFFPKAQSRLIKEILRLVKGNAEVNSRRITEIIEGGELAQAIQSGNSLPNAQESSAAIQTE